MEQLGQPLVNQITEELNGSKSDRGTAILGSSLVEELLRALLLKVAVPNKDFKLFIDRSPASNLLAIAYSFGFLPNELRHDIKLIFKIRNKFAHSWNLLSFDTPPISNIIPNLIAPKKFGKIRGNPVLVNNGQFAKTLADVENRMQFIATVIATSTSLEHIQNEIVSFVPSERFYVAPK
ncbi:MAG: hypothetical protein AAF327_20125 [Cyanobacteria bacterium P01_A01_bin.37]